MSLGAGIGRGADACNLQAAAITDPDSRKVVNSLLAYKVKVASYGQQTMGAVLRTR